MVLLKLLATVNTQLNQIRKKPDTDTTVLGGLAIVTLMEDFYQFFLVVGRPSKKKPSQQMSYIAKPYRIILF